MPINMTNNIAYGCSLHYSPLAKRSVLGIPVNNGTGQCDMEDIKGSATGLQWSEPSQKCKSPANTHTSQWHWDCFTVVCCLIDMLDVTVWHTHSLHWLTLHHPCTKPSHSLPPQYLCLSDIRLNKNTSQLHTAIYSYSTTYTNFWSWFTHFINQLCGITLFSCPWQTSPRYRHIYLNPWH